MIEDVSCILDVSRVEACLDQASVSHYERFICNSTYLIKLTLDGMIKISLLNQILDKLKDYWIHKIYHIESFITPSCATKTASKVVVKSS